MEMLRSAARELIRRPDDEHHSFPTFKATALRDRHVGREANVNARSLLFSAVEPGSLPGAGDVVLDTGSGNPSPLAFFALQQCATLAGTSPAFLSRVQPQTRARILNEAIDRDQLTDRKVLQSEWSGGPIIRAMTSTSYRRLWDADIVEQVERWLLPRGWIPAVPTESKAWLGKDKDGNTLNTKGDARPALFRGDRDSFAFFYSPESKRPDLGGLRRGIVIYNSEVGARSFGFDTFLFRDLCANFLIWDASQVKRRRARHVGKVHSLFGDFRLLLQEYSQDLDNETQRRIDQAAAAMFAESTPKAEMRDNAAERLQRQYDVGQARSLEIVDAALLPVNRTGAQSYQRTIDGTDRIDYWSIANGASYLAHHEANADDKMELAGLAGEVLTGVGQ